MIDSSSQFINEQEFHDKLDEETLQRDSESERDTERLEKNNQNTMIEKKELHDKKEEIVLKK
jgi:hypothetical protein